jgi:hypothetical protein
MDCLPGPVTRLFWTPRPPTQWRELRRRALALPLALLVGAFGASAASAAQLVPQNLTKLIGSADVIVAGTVKNVTDGFQDGVPYTEVTITVASAAKKSLATRSQFKFRQFGLLKPRKTPDGRTLLAMAPEGFAQWRRDEQVIAFMYKPATRTGLRTTVGLAQGKLTTLGGRTANAFNNRGLFANVQVQPGLLSSSEADMLKKPSGDVDPDVLMKLVGRAVAGQWVERGVMR